jgi:TonB family protein
VQEKDMQHLTSRLTIVLLSVLSGLFVPAFSARAQENLSTQDGGKWERYTGRGEAFTVLLPAPPKASVANRPVRFILGREAERYRGTLYSSYSDGVAYLIYSFPRHSESIKQFVNEFTNHYARTQEVVSSRDINLNNVSGQRHLIKFRDLDGVLDFYVTDKRAYILHVIGADESNPAIKRFLESFTLSNSEGKGQATDSAAIEIKPDSKKTPQIDDSQDTEPAYSSRDVTRKAVIIVRPEPEYTEEARAHRAGGTVILKVVLSSSGKVTGIEVEKSLPRGLTEKAIEAARRLIFIPAMKDGKFVSQRVHVEYGFSVY